ncbi:lipopolysaccharide biosynthesis protein [Gemmiger qucibialis]|uniref:lipopolysaccharide biosynthesis protein n=1 Tax=Gemmiger qucibialis TaxID=2997294 RepID=UPI0022E844F1|nr:MATE family efflux transporter [Gemmiger qucibialis]
MDSVKELVSSGIWNSINNLGNVLNSGLDLIITNLMLTATAMGQISVAKNLATICYTLVGTIANAFKPLQTRYYAEGNTELLVSSLKRSMKITGLVCGLLIAGFFSYGTPFLRLWLTDSQNISLIFKISMIVLFSDIVIGVVNPLYYVYTLTNKLRLPCYITLAMGTANVIGMYVLIKYTSLGEYAVVLTTMVLNLIHLIDAPIYSAYCLKIKISTFYPVILRHLIACVVNVILIRVLAGVLPDPSSWLILCVDCLIVGVCALLVEFIVLFDRNEISEFARKVKNKIA